MKEPVGKKEPANAEFSVEFGDVNGIKLYEIPFMSKKQKPNKKKKK